MRKLAGSILLVILLIVIMNASSHGQDGPCTFSASPDTIFFQLPGGTAEVYVMASSPTCTFAARSLYPWITVFAQQNRGDGKVLVSVDGNMGMTHRVGAVLIDGIEVSIVQYGPRRTD